MSNPGRCEVRFGEVSLFRDLPTGSAQVSRSAAWSRRDASKDIERPLRRVVHESLEGLDWPSTRRWPSSVRLRMPRWRVCPDPLSRIHEAELHIAIAGSQRTPPHDRSRYVIAWLLLADAEESLWADS